MPTTTSAQQQSIWQMWEVYALFACLLLAAALGFFFIIRALLRKKRSDSSETWNIRNGNTAVDSCGPYEELRGSYRPHVKSLSEESKVPSGGSSSTSSSSSSEFSGNVVNAHRYKRQHRSSNKAGSEGGGRRPSSLRGSYDLRDGDSKAAIDGDDGGRKLGREATLRSVVPAVGDDFKTPFVAAFVPDPAPGRSAVSESEKRWSEVWKLKFDNQPIPEGRVSRTTSSVLGHQHRDSCYSTMSETSSGNLTRGASVRSTGSEGTGGRDSRLLVDPTGQLLFSVEFIPLVSFRGRLRVTVLEGIDLPARPYGGLASPFVEVRLVKWDKYQSLAVNQRQKQRRGLGPLFSFFYSSGRRDGPDGCSDNGKRAAEPEEGSAVSSKYGTLREEPSLEDLRPTSPVLFASRTETVKKTRNPNFGQVLEAELNASDLMDTSIQLTLYDDDKYGNPTMLGMTSHALPKDELASYIGKAVVLSNCIIPTTESKGTMQICLNYMPTAKRLVVGVLRCTQLTLCNGDLGSTEFSVKIFLLSASGRLYRRRKSNAVPLDKDNPSEVQLDESFFFNLSSCQLVSVTALLVLFARRSAASSTTSSSSPRSRGASPAPSPFITSPAQLLEVASIRADGGASRSEYPQHGNGSPSPQPDSEPADVDSRSTSRCSNDVEETRRQHEQQPKAPRLKRPNKQLVPIGKVALGQFVTRGKGQAHWRSMVNNPRNQVTEWHAMF